MKYLEKIKNRTIQGIADNKKLSVNQVKDKIELEASFGGSKVIIEPRIHLTYPENVDYVFDVFKEEGFNIVKSAPKLKSIRPTLTISW